MVGERLHEFDLSLCDYALGNVRQYLDKPAFARWAARMVSPPTLRDYLLRSDLDPLAEQERLLLNDKEFDALALAFGGGPLEYDREWLPYPALHDRYTETVKEVRDGLAKQVGEDWAATCGRFAERLEKEGLGLPEGIRVVHEWVQKLRRLLRSMEAFAYLPRPEGRSPTPTTLHMPGSFTTSSPNPLYAGLSTSLIDAIKVMRKAIESNTDGKKTKAKSLVRSAKIRATNAYAALRWLAEHGEYEGYTPRRRAHTSGDPPA